ncbi:hypothetical protein N665_0223s0008 [Sinapis alba]|nr:hypothetical protein N665_0223s0008 [Sinapis alba]
MDVSEAQSHDYPPRLYPEGAYNLEGKDINHNFHIGEFHHVREAIGRDVCEELERSHIGVIAKLAGRKSVWFSLHEFGEITGLNTNPVPTESFEHDQYKAFWEELNIPLGMRPKLDKLKATLEVCPPWIFEKHKWIPFESAKGVFDDEAMMSYLWGRTAYEVLVDSIKMLDSQGGSYTIRSMKDVLLVWAYEFRTRASFATLFSEEIREHGDLSYELLLQVRVRKMAMKDSVEEMFPQWPGEDENPQLVNLITNIHTNRFVRGFWEVQGNEKKKKVKDGVSSEVEPPTKKQKKVKKQSISLTSEEEGREEIVNNAFLMNIMNTLENISRKLDHHEGRFEMIDPMIDKTHGKDLGAKKNLVEELNKATGMKKTLVEDFVSGTATPSSGGATHTKADALDFLYISPAKADKDAKAAKTDKAANAAKAVKVAKAQKDGKDEAGQAFGRGCRGKPKAQEALLKKEAAAKKRAKASKKGAEAAIKRKEAAELKIHRSFLCVLSSLPTVGEPNRGPISRTSKGSIPKPRFLYLQD